MIPDRRDPSSGELLHHVLQRAVLRRRNGVALRDTEGSLTYVELLDLVERIGGWLREQGVGAGDRVAVRATSDRWTVALLYASSLCGAVFTPISPAMRRFQLEHVLADAEPRLLVTADPGDLGWPQVPTHDPTALRAAARSTRPVGPVSEPEDPNSPAILLYTSGSTGQPKAVVCPPGQVVFAARAVAERLGYRAEDVVYCRLPLSFDYGLYQSILCCLAAAELVLASPGHDAGMLVDIRRHGATVVPLVPSMAAMLLQLASRDGRPTAIRLFTNTGEHLHGEARQGLRRHFPNAGLQVMYGLTECKRVSVMEVDGDLARPDSVGRPIPGTRVHAVDEVGTVLPPGQVGELVVQGPHVMGGYWRAPELTGSVFVEDSRTGARVLRTGDVGYLDDLGYVYLHGRRDDIFKQRGVRTSASEIRHAALTLADVSEAVVLPPSGTRDAVLFVIGDVTPTAVLRRLRGLLDPAKVPSTCVVLDAFPLAPNGKTDRARLADLVWGANR